MTAAAPQRAPRKRPDWRQHPHELARLCWCGHRRSTHAAGTCTGTGCSCPTYVLGIQP